MCLRDFDDYLRASAEIEKTYLDKTSWNNKALVNIAEAGIFAADRSIGDYARNIWHVKPLK